MKSTELKTTGPRPVRPADRDEWIRMRTALWSDGPEDHPPEVDAWLEEPPTDREVFVLERGERGGRGEAGRVAGPEGATGGDAGAPAPPSGPALGGFVEVSLRSAAEGCDSSPVGYLEGLWLDPDLRGRGLARHLVEVAEAWARARGCTEMASDAAVDNARSIAVHTALGYDEVVRAVCFRKSLD